MNRRRRRRDHSQDKAADQQCGCDAASSLDFHELGHSFLAAVTLDVEGDARTLGYDEVAKALVQIEFNRKPAREDHEEA